MEISIVILSCVILGLNPEMPVFIRLIMICNINGFRQIKYIHTTKAVSTRQFSEPGAIDRDQFAPSCPCPHGSNRNARSGF